MLHSTNFIILSFCEIAAMIVRLIGIKKIDKQGLLFVNNGINKQLREKIERKISNGGINRIIEQHQSPLQFETMTKE